MNYKKQMLFVILLFLFSLNCLGEEISYAAKSFRSSIQSFLREEGFAPTIDNDESLCFKKEGVAYWIDILGEKPFYVTFHREGIGAENANEGNILKAINEINTNIRAIKCCYVNNYISLGIESYCYVAEDFKYVFYSYLNILDAADGAVKEAYAKYDNSLSSFNQASSSNKNSVIGSVSGRSGNKVYLSAPILESSYHKWWANSIELNTHSTVVSKTVVPKVAETYVCSTRDEYIEDCDTGKRYYIISSTIGIQPQNTVLHTKGPKSFSDTYQALPASVKRISIWSGSDYYIKNLQIR